jgi:hypothetical protein
MKFSTALSLLSAASGAWATNHIVEVIAEPVGTPVEHMMATEAAMIETTTAAMMHEVVTVTAPAHIVTTTAAEEAMMDTTPPMHEVVTTSTAMAHTMLPTEMAAAAMTHTVCPALPLFFFCEHPLKELPY